MPVLKVKHVVSFSCEDPKNPADNILKDGTYYKWRCSSAGGETSATILLQLEKASQITGIDIGNNGSAFIEVLVGRSSWSQEEEFKVLLAASSFMSPADSKTGKNISTVRMFGLTNLNKTVAAEKWDQIRIVCTQPYNQTEPYGLSFVKFYSPAEVSEEPQEKVIKLGRFNLKSDSDDDNFAFSSGSFFQNRMNIPTTQTVIPKMTMAASARSSNPSPRTDTIFKTKEETSTGPKRITISEDKRKEVANALLQGSSNSSIKKDNVLPKGKTPETAKKVSETPKHKTSDSAKRIIESDNIESPKAKGNVKNDKSSNESQAPPTKKLKIISKPKVKKKNVSYNKIMEGVIFTLSGYQNPERGNIRDLALTMGAKYEPSWSNRCTHLICAFANTPKFKEVKGKGKIIRKRWIDDCHKCKRRLNTKSYRLDGGGDSSYESSATEDEDNVHANSGDIANTDRKKQVQKLDIIQKSSSDCDTEDELEQIRLLEKKNLENEVSSANQLKDKENLGLEEEDIYGATTDEGDDEDTLNYTDSVAVNKETPDLPILLEFFKEKIFFLFGEFDTKDSSLLKRYIMKYFGSIADYMNDSINYVISEENWDDNFQQALKDNPSLVFIRPLWIFKCHEKQKFIPYETYEIKPS